MNVHGLKIIEAYFKLLSQPLVAMKEEIYENPNTLKLTFPTCAARLTT
jgi:hypothetical protein